MKKTLLILASIICIEANAQPIVPQHKSTTYINDFANVIDDSKEPILDAKIRAFMEKSSIEMTVVSINSLDGYDIDSYANTLFRSWGIGKKELNNGLLILFSVSDRKWRIEVGTGLEEYMPDGYVKVEAKNVLVPYFKEKDYFAGVNALLDNFIAKLGTESWAQRQELARKQAAEAKRLEEEFSDGLVTFFSWFGVIAILTFVIIMFVRNERKKREKIEAEAKEKKLKLEKLISDNNSSINSFQRIFVWAKDNKELFRLRSWTSNNIDVNFNDFDSAKKKLDDLLSQRNLTIEYLESEQILIRNIIQTIPIDKIQNLYSSSISFSGLKNSIKEYHTTTTTIGRNISTTASNHKKLTEAYGTSIVNVPFPQDSLNTKLDIVITSLLKLQSNSTKTLDDYPIMKKDFENIQLVVKEINSSVDSVNKKLESITNAIQYVSSNRGRINSLVNEAQRKVKDSDVSSSTKSKFNVAKSKAEMFKESTNPVIAYNEMYALIQDLNSVIKKASDEVEEEERRRRRIREEEEESSRRSSYSSSTSDYGSSSSGSSSDFGGGSSSGGGASGDW